MLTPEHILGASGRIAARLPNYEERPQQLEMAAAVHESLAQGEHLIVEAGTGVGKSFAYLVPAILAASEGGDVKRVVISTHTISLQEQLMAKDIPLLNSVIPREFTAVLAKGRRNYVSLRRLGAAASRGDSLFPDDAEAEQLRDLVAWSQRTYDGSLSDVGFKPRAGVWDEVASDSANCLGKKCRHRDECFYFMARSRIHNAQIIVVNHALFFSDLALRRHEVSVLPNYDAVVFDEAHTLESVAGDHLGMGVTNGQVGYVLRKLFNDHANSGLLVHHHLIEAQQATTACQIAADHFFDDLKRWHEQSANGRVMAPGVIGNQLTPMMKQLAEQLKLAAEGMKDASDKKDLNSAETRLTVLADEIEAWRTQQLEDAVYWLEVSRRRTGAESVKLAAAPIDVGPAMRSQLFDKVRSVIMTSATLSTGDSFDFFQSRIGLSGCRTVSVGSPFDYQRQAKLVLVRGMADPGSQRELFETQCAEMIKRYVLRTDGRAFVLFTSYQMMRTVAKRLQPWLIEHNYPLHSQADGTPRSAMLREFLRNPRSVLFGADSFWQGVDVQGDALRNVIITKLPFSVPDQPLLQARLDAIKEAGGNPFRDFQLPEAVIKMRQGFGRLIRSQDDEGIVVVLDPRMTTRPYGRAFIQALPDCQLIEEPFIEDGVDEFAG
ncbi:MAG: DEAD/DEAH box helicase [Planctomycetales bacterium]|nr:DEAD/DEAH box helicase [Planctomycetales bacterium]